MIVKYLIALSPDEAEPVELPEVSVRIGPRTASVPRILNGRRLSAGHAIRRIRDRSDLGTELIEIEHIPDATNRLRLGLGTGQRFYLWEVLEDGDTTERVCWARCLNIRLTDTGTCLEAENVYGKWFDSMSELRDHEKRLGHYGKSACGCNGHQDSIVEWFKRVIRRPSYVYTLGVRPGSQRENSQGLVYQTEANYTIHRYQNKTDVADELCACGRWTQVFPDDKGSELVIPMLFHDARTATDYMRRLQTGIPQNWELLAALGGFALFASEVLYPVAKWIVSLFG